MLIDSHAHLPHDLKAATDIIQRAKDNDVTHIINIGTELQENQHVLTIADSFPNVFAALAIYPHSNQEKANPVLVSELEMQITASKKILAVGECGIDISDWESQRPLEQQIELFEMQIELALRHNLPIVIHNRNGDKEIINILSKYKNKGIKGVQHCFNSSYEVAKKMLDLGFYLSFSGFITHNSKSYLLETVSAIPEDRFLVETDSPYILPKGINDKHNEPKNVKIVAQKVAEIKKIPLETIAEMATKNTKDLFKIESKI